MFGKFSSSFNQIFSKAHIGNVVSVFRQFFVGDMNGWRWGVAPRLDQLTAVYDGI